MKSRRQNSSGRCGIPLYIAAFSAMALIVFFFIAEDLTRSSLPHIRLHSRQETAATRATHFNNEQNSKFAYVTLLSGIDSSFKYRGFLYNVLIMKKALVQSGSVADLIALIGLSEKDISPFQSDLDLLRNAGVLIHILPRFLDEHHDLGFAEMALLKITPWSFTQYEKIQFFDGDIMPLQNMDCFFQLEFNSFTVGAVSPLNSGWYLAIPQKSAYDYMKERSIWRLGRDWDKETGWNERMPEGLMYRGGKETCKRWEFNGADMDQGLLLHHFVINEGNSLLIDTETKLARYFKKGLLHEQDKVLTTQNSLSCCMGILPTQAFAHFTGRSKPWMLDSEKFRNARKGGSLETWINHLDSLNLPINSSNILEMGLGSPLGFFNAGFPKGGFKKIES